jgi:hypothetical protein
VSPCSGGHPSPGEMRESTGVPTRPAGYAGARLAAVLWDAISGREAAHSVIFEETCVYVVC